MTFELLGPRPLPSVWFSRDLGHDTVRAPVAAGELVPVRAGAYAEPSDDDAPNWQREVDSALQHLAAVSAQLECDRVISHQSAALLHGCWTGKLDGRTHLTQPFRPDENDVQGVRRHFAVLAAEDVVEIHGIQTTSVERTMEDCARSLHPRDGLRVADSALRLLEHPDRFDRDASQRRLHARQRTIQARLEQKKGWRGVVRGRAVLAAADGWSESAGESALRWVVLSRGLPAPVCQYPVTAGGRDYFLDLGWDLCGTTTDTGAVVLGEEYDGVEKYAELGEASGRPLFDEKQREDALRRERVHLRRRVSGDFADPDRLAADVAARFPHRIAIGFRPVPGLMVAAPRRQRAR